ncbi:unnamed protein product [Ilex paraguariensis]|uniref:Plasma membrane-associated cation-binding protein 1 n=1 Tax=Ilex paraguariensis TaxID=185542 RepID=A0ABC8UQS9_9AQUA
MGYWQSKVLPKIKKVFEKNGAKKAAATEACKSFDDAKEEYSKVFEEKKTELQPKVVEIYEASSTVVKTLVKEPNDAGLKKNSAAVQKFLDELVKIDFPGSLPVSKAIAKFGAPLVPGPIFFVFEKVSTFIVTEEKKEEEAPAETSSKVKELVVEEEKKEEVVAEAAEKTEPPAEAAPASTEPPKEEEAPPAETIKP